MTTKNGRGAEGNRVRPMGAWLLARLRPLRFAATGGTAGALQLALLALLTTRGWNASVANLVAFAIAAQLNFALSATFTWRDRQSAGTTLWRRWLTFHGSIIGMAVVNMAVFALAHQAVPALLASALGIATAGLGNYIIGDRVTFAVRATAGSAGTAAQVASGWRDVVMNAAMETETEMKLEMERSADRDGAPVYSVVAPVYDEEETLPHFYARLQTVLEAMGQPFEIVFVDDGSRDRSLEVLEALRARDHRVRIVGFSRNFGHQVAITAGLDHALGRAVVVIDADLQDPPEVIPDLAARWLDGAEVVYAQRRSRPGETRFKLLTASFFYWLIRRLTRMDIPRDTGDFRLLDRRVVDTLVAMREHHRFMRGLAVWVGFRQEAVPYDRQERFAGTTKYPLAAMVRFALDAITGFSYVPLQLATTLGFALAGVSVLGIVVAAALRLGGVAIQGQATTLIAVLLLGGIQLIVLGIMGEYLGRIYDEVRARPLYVARCDSAQRAADGPRERTAGAIGAPVRDRTWIDVSPATSRATDPRPATHAHDSSGR